MAGRARYTEDQKKEVFLALTFNEGNVKKTARETGIPEQTVRNWKKEWTGGAAKPVSDEQLDEIRAAWVEKAIDVRAKLLLSIEADVDENALSPRDKLTAFGILDDKIARAQGLDRARSGEVHIHLPSPDELRQGLASLVVGAIQGVQQRTEDIIDAEIVEQPRALPA